MNAPVSRLKDPDMQAVPAALLRAAENARRLAEQTGTPFIVRQPIEPKADAEGAAKAGASDDKA